MHSQASEVPEQSLVILVTVVIIPIEDCQGLAREDSVLTPGAQSVVWIGVGTVPPLLVYRTGLPISEDWYLLQWFQWDWPISKLQ